MSLKIALSTANDISILNGILTISEIDISLKKSILYACFVRDIHLIHPQHGPGLIENFHKGKWLCDFDYSTHPYELTTKQLMNCIN